MTDERWHRVKELFQAAVERPPSERSGFLAAAAAGDETLRREVESLLSADAAAVSVFDRLPLADAAVLGEPLGTSSMFGEAPALAATGGARLTGRSIAHYRIGDRIGAGGMGEVYHGRDTKLGRDVAIKVLHPSFAPDSERLLRVEREARVLAALNHPHIAAIYGFEVSDRVHALVLELVEGPTLADRLAAAPIAIDEALALARQIAEALEAAHAKAIVHRDLKPANIKIAPGGLVKVLDFGLAKVFGSPQSEFDRSSVTTLAANATGAGRILGTPAYMSPEQARGEVVDRRSDIWAFGCVLYEMLTGRAAFAANTLADTIPITLVKGPDWGGLPENTPPGIRRLLRRCLEQDPRRRLHDIADARIEIDDAISGADHDRTAGADLDHRPARRWRAATTTASAAALLIAAALLAWRSNDSTTLPDAAEMRLQIVTPPSASLADFAISPDGRKLVFHADGRLWLRLLERDTAQPLAGTETGIRPFWSTDSESVGFFAGGQLKRVDISTGLTRTLVDAPVSNGGAWNKDGVILFGKSSTGPLYRTRAGGGEVVEATSAALPGHAGHRHPQFLPDGRHFLFFALGTPQTRGLYVGSLDSMEVRRLFDADSAGVFAPPDHVLFAQHGALMAQRVDMKAFEPLGDPIPLAAQVSVDGVGASYVGAGMFSIAASASAAGPVAYRPTAGKRQLVWLDRTGREIGRVGDPDGAAGDSRLIRPSPDGRYVALDRIVDGNRDVWLLEIDRGILHRFTYDAARDNEAMWSPDSRRIVFTSLRNGLPDLYEKPVGAAGSESLVFSSPEFKNVYDWSRDGQYILYASQTSNAGRDLWALPMIGERKPLVVANTPFEESGGRFSPDGRWVAYIANESGRVEIYVQRFPGRNLKTQISTAGGSRPQWRRDGRELFYVANNQLMAVPITTNDTSVMAGAPMALFPMMPGSDYTASPDGQRFLVSRVAEDAAPITVLLNWRR